jgi:hypothetical protein
VAVKHLVAWGAAGTVTLSSAQGHLLLDAGAQVQADAVELRAPEGLLYASAGSRVQAGSLTVETALGIGGKGAPVTLAVDRLAARTGSGGIHLRDSGGLRLSGVGLQVESAEGDIELEVTGGNLTMDADAALLTQGGRIDVAVQQGGLAVSRVDAGSGAIHVSVDGAIVVQTGDPQAHLRTSGVLTLEARNGIGGFGAAQLRVDAGELRARNTQAGNVVIFGERGLWLGDEGVSSASPTGYVVLLSDTGRIDTGKVEAINGRIVLMTGLTSLTEAQVADLYCMLLQRRMNDPSIAARDHLTDNALAAMQPLAGRTVELNPPAWSAAAAPQPVHTTSVLLASALELLSFAKPVESGLLDTLPQRMRQVEDAQPEEGATSWQPPEDEPFVQAFDTVPASAVVWHEQLQALWLPDAVPVPIVVPQDAPAGVPTDDRAEAGDEEVLPQAET